MTASMNMPTISIALPGKMRIPKRERLTQWHKRWYTDFPEVESAVSITPMWGLGLTRESFSFRNPEKEIQFEENNVMAVDSTFFDVFTFPLLKGDPKTALKNPDGILISSSMSKKYFGDEDPLGKQLAVNDEKELIQVVGVFEDVPAESHFHFDFLVSYVREKLRRSRK